MGLPAAALVLAVGVTAAVAVGTRGGSDAGLGRIEPAAFQSFGSCSDLLGYLRSNAERLVGPFGLPGQPQVRAMGAVASAVGTDAAAGAPLAAPGVAPGAAPGAAPGVQAGGGGEGSGTNVQVAGVDEADLVKVDGDLLLSVTDGVLHVSAMEKGRVRVVGHLSFDGWLPQQMLVDGDRLLLVASSGGFAVPMMGMAPGMPVRPRRVARDAVHLPPPQDRLSTRVVQVDLARPAQPRALTVLDLDGSLAGARLAGGVVRLALSTTGPRLEWSYPADDSAAERSRALAANRATIEGSHVEDWLPGYSVVDLARAGAGAQTGLVTDCSNVDAPRAFSGLDTLSLLTVDLRTPVASGGAGITAWSAAAVVASGSTLYATAQHTYVATSPWQDWAAMDPAASQAAITRQRTQIFLFDTTDVAAPRFVASGEVPGFLLGQFAMDEYRGRLRVASTTEPPFPVAMPADVGESAPVSKPGTDATMPPPSRVVPRPVPSRSQSPSQSQVTVLTVRGRLLEHTGAVTGLGRGETIRGVRFAGPSGYVVTYRQTDPLYVVDLRDPARPVLSGELKLLGYSAYLHPVGDGLLLGLGQAGDAAGRTEGLQMSLFDVSDPAAPRLLDRVKISGAGSDVEGDHHAFTFADALALAPFTRWGGPATVGPDSPAPEPVDPSSGSGSATGPGSAPGSSASSGSGSGSSASSGSSGAGGAVAPTPPALLPMMQTYDAGVLAVALQGHSLGRVHLLRPLAGGPARIDMNSDMTRYQDLLAAVPLRTVVYAGTIFTVTPLGIAAHDAHTFTRLGFTRF